MQGFSEVLRRAEEGERFTITVDGRPVAELTPLTAGRRPASPGRLASILSETPVDLEWRRDLERLRDEDNASAREPWIE